MCAWNEIRTLRWHEEEVNTSHFFLLSFQWNTFSPGFRKPQHHYRIHAPWTICRPPHPGYVLCTFPVDSPPNPDRESDDDGCHQDGISPPFTHVLLPQSPLFPGSLFNFIHCVQDAGESPVSQKSVSIEGCLAQAFSVFSIAGTEAFMLSAMAYDHYTAICHPLLYGQMMSKQPCGGLVWLSWGLGFLDALINSLMTLSLDFCGAHIMPHFSCELPSLFSLSCSDISINFSVLGFSTIVRASGTLLLVFFSKARIVSTILNISSTAGRSKAFSTCSSHLTAVSFFYGSAFLCYLVPTLFPCWS